MFLTADLSGSTPSFFSSTMVSRETFSASCRCASLSASAAGICAYFTIDGGSNSPNWNRALNSRVRLTSTSFWLISPCFIASR